jgi:hypothetical protein
VLGPALVLEQQVDGQCLARVADAIDQVGVRRAQVGGDVAVFADRKRRQVQPGEQCRRELAAQEVAGDLASGEALAEEGVVG